MLPLGWSRLAIDIGIRANFCCEYCGRDLISTVDDYNAWQIDYILPKNRGGEDLSWNLALICKTCCFIKSNTIPTGMPHPHDDREGAVAAIAKLVQHRRARKQEHVDFLRHHFRATQEPSPVRET